MHISRQGTRIDDGLGPPDLVPLEWVAEVVEEGEDEQHGHEGIEREDLPDAQPPPPLLLVVQQRACQTRTREESVVLSEDGGTVHT
jgi:hypothetical protein